MRRIVYPLVWLAVTVTAVLIASAAVSSVRDQVTETPTAMLPPTTIAVSSTGQIVADPIQPETPTPDGDQGPGTTTTTAPTTTTTTTVQPETSTTTTSLDSEPIQTTTTTLPTTTTIPAPTTTTSAPTSEIRSYELVGGSVSVEIGDGVVRLAGASPKPGFAMEVENSGPEKVEVEFHSDDHESDFTGSFEDGTFVPSISESSREDDD